MNLRKYIREIILEALETSHYKERLNDRIKEAIPTIDSYQKSEIKIPSHIITKVLGFVNLVKIINFPNNESYAIKLINLDREYKAEESFGKESVGDTIWVLVRNNEIKTIMLRGRAQQDNIPDIQYYIKNPEMLQSYYNIANKDKEGQVNFNWNAYNSMVAKTKIQKNSNSLANLPKVKLVDGWIWRINADEKRLIKVNKQDKILDVISDYENNLSDEDLEKVYEKLEQVKYFEE